MAKKRTKSVNFKVRNVGIAEARAKYSHFGTITAKCAAEVEVF